MNLLESDHGENPTGIESPSGGGTLCRIGDDVAGRGNDLHSRVREPLNSY